MRPFDKDLFSVSTPVWTKCNSEKRSDILEFIKCNLPKYSHDDIAVFQVGGLEINSSNYKFTSKDPNNSIVLKKWPKDISSDKVIFHNEILTFLNRENIPSPNLLSFDDSVDFVQHQGEYWTAQSFQAGTFFDGNAELSEKLIAQVINLQSSLKKFHSENSHFQIQEIEYDIEIIETVKKNSVNFDLYFDSNHSKLLRDNWNLIIEEYYLTVETLLKYSEKDLCHLDLHPHNILVNKTNVVSFLDFDSVKLINRPIAIAYFALKMCKQICSLRTIDPSVLGQSFKEQLSQSSSEMRNASSDLSYLANAEVIRRICIILRLNIEENNRLWNHVLPILINHLIESKWLFRT